MSMLIIGFVWFYIRSYFTSTIVLCFRNLYFLLDCLESLIQIFDNVINIFRSD